MHHHHHALELSIGLSFLLGALHALEPGHGKTAMYVYLMGSRRSYWHPLVISLSTAISHGVSLMLIAVLVHLGMHLMTDGNVDEHAGAMRLLTWTSVSLMFLIGVVLLYRALRGRTAPRRCGCHAHRESAPASHSTLPTLNAPLHHETCRQASSPRGNLRTTVLMGIAVGLMPCPTAMAAYLTGISSGSPLSGYLVLVMFSVGIACSLFFCGIALQWFGHKLSQFSKGASSVRRWEIAQACLILLLAVFYLARAMW